MVVDVRFKTGEYHLGDIHGYPPVVGGNIRSRDFQTNRAQAKIIDGSERYILHILTNYNIWSKLFV